MSNLLNDDLQNSREQSPCQSVKQIIRPNEKDLGDLSVRRLFPTTGFKSVGPWVFFDHMGPASFQPGQGVNVRPHPHIGIATVTYVFEGEILHRDSLGSKQSIAPGDINLMVAGKGIVHSERERKEITNSRHNLNGLQLWMALPENKEETEPEFHHYSKSNIPSLMIDGVDIRVMIGSAYGKESPVKTFSETLYVEAEMAPSSSLDVPRCEECAVYVADGEIEIDGTKIEKFAMALLNSEKPTTIKATKKSRIAIIGGENLGKRYIDWNFVSSSKERISEARENWKSGKFPTVPGDEEEYIPLP